MRSRRHAAALILLAAVAPAAGSAPAGTIWLEGENPAESSMRRHGWYDSVKKVELSGGDWAGHFSDEAPGRATSSWLTGPSEPARGDAGVLTDS
jgi:hypothetical protein